MGDYKIGYANGLDNTVNYATGKALYSGASYTLDSKMVCRAVGEVDSVSTTAITCTSVINYPNETNTSFDDAPTTFTTNEFIRGFVRMLTGSCKDVIYKIASNSEGVLTCVDNVSAAGVAAGDYFECVSGSCTFTFTRNPQRRDDTKKFNGAMQRLSYYLGSLVIPIKWEDDVVMVSYLSQEKDIDRLEVLLNHILDYKGFDSIYSTGVTGDNSYGSAPMIIQADTEQHLLFLNDYKIIKDGKRGDGFYEVMIHGQNYI